MSLDLYRERHGIGHDEPGPVERSERGIVQCVRQIDELLAENQRLRDENAALRSLNEELSDLVGMKPPPLTRAVMLGDRVEDPEFWAG